MHLKQARNKKTGRTYLSIVQSYRDKEKGYSRAKTIEKIGYLDELQKKYDDPIDHFKNLVAEKNAASLLETSESTIKFNKGQILEKGTSNRKNYGYIVILKILTELGLERFLINRKQSTKLEYSTNSIMKLLIISRILSPGSKKRAFEEKEKYFDFEGNINFDLNCIYRSLSHFSALAKDMQLLIHDRINKCYGRKTNLVYYDITNYYFEIDKEDELRKKGYSKENRKSPIVQLGLSMDGEGIPISYELFPGNESEKLHLRPMISELVRKYDTGKIIAVADSAQNTGNNIYYLDQAKQGYIFSQSIAGGNAEFKGYVTSESGYVWFGEKYKRKSRICRREISVEFVRGKDTFKKKVLVDQRQIVFYSEKYAKRAKEKREATIKKAYHIINNPGAYTSATSYGALKYVKNVEVDKKTGEIKKSKGQPLFDFKKLQEEEKYDGYYAIITNVFNEETGSVDFDDDAIIRIYRGLWKIEDCFRVSKSDLETRPVFLSRRDRIESHFLICFISLVVMRLIQKKTNNSISAEKLIEAINKVSCSLEEVNLFLFDHRCEVTDSLGEAFGLDFTKKRMTRSEIKKNLGIAKK